MSIQRVLIHYGPIETFNIPVYKKQKIAVLRDELRRLGYHVDERPVKLLNVCILEMCGHEVFRCNVKYLRFNRPFEEDPICQRAVASVEEASKKFLRCSNYLWCQRKIDTLVYQMFSRSTNYDPEDKFPINFEVKPFVQPLDCINCCHILVAKKTKEELEQDNDAKRMKLTRPKSVKKKDKVVKHAKIRV